MNLMYFWAKIVKKCRGSAVLNSKIPSTSKVESGSHVINSTFGKHSFCGYNCEIVNSEIGSFCSLSSHVVIGGGMHPLEWVSTSPVFYEGRDSVKAKFSQHPRSEPKKTYVGHDVWIGERVIIKQGVSVGTGAVIGMGSVVTKDVKPYTIVAGCPAKFIRNRFKEEIIEKLLEIKWWEFSDEALIELGEYVTDPEEFIRRVAL
jgi:acetyltransferase-like isoleucine patch superfamily enzyme